LDAEIEARWSLLEAAFEQKRTNSHLINDERAIYLSDDHSQRIVTQMRPVLHGYQIGRCFYCGEPMSSANGHVDHLIPRRILHHDHPWNLVLAHSSCMED